MHIPCMPKIVRKTYMQLGTYNQNPLQLLIPMSSCDFMLFLCLFLQISKYATLSKSAPRKLSEYPRVWERERERERERENNGKTPKLHWAKAMNWSSQAFLLMRPLFSSFSVIFLHFPPHMKPVTFHLPFLLISIIFINKCAKNTFCLFNASASAFANFHSHNKPCEYSHYDVLPNIQLGIRVPWPWLLFFLY